MNAQPIFKTTSPEYLTFILQKQETINKAKDEKLAAFEEAEALRKSFVRKYTLMRYIPEEQAVAIMKSMVDATDDEFNAVVATFAPLCIKPLVKAADVEVVVEPVDLTRAILEAKYGKK